jgi:hypothetical protein
MGELWTPEAGDFSVVITTHSTIRVHPCLNKLVFHRSSRSDRTKRSYFCCSLFTVHCSLFTALYPRSSVVPACGSFSGIPGDLQGLDNPVYAARSAVRSRPDWKKILIFKDSKPDHTGQK